MATGCKCACGDKCCCYPYCTCPGGEQDKKAQSFAQSMKKMLPMSDNMG